jgi:glycosyltransferase involved in cell wall biosynthesis
MRSEIEQLIIAYELADHVKLIGWRNTSDVRSEIQEARALVLPSFAEGLPVVLMESLALGRPVVTTYVAGIPELVRHGINGWLVPAGDISALTEALADVLQTPLDRLAVMGRDGAEAVRVSHDARREAERLVELFRCP